MKTLTLQRIYKGSDCTLGVLYDDSFHPFMVTLEEPWQDNKRGISCIPEGLYVCKPHNGTKFKDVWQVTNVKDRTAILIHSGNSTDDIEGCILVGERHGSLNNKKAVLGSKNALAELKSYIGRDTEQLKQFLLNIVSV